MAQLRGLLALTLALVCGVMAAPAAADPIDDYVKGEMATRKIPGAAVAVIRNGRVIKRTAYGLASVEHNVPVKTDTVFVLASTSKLFAASAIMTLVQDGKLTLDQSVREILPELPAAWAPVTVRQCLSHTTGLPELDTDELNITPSVGDAPALIKAVADRPVQPAGSRVAYGGTSYALIGMVIERLSGKPFGDYVHDRVLLPAGLGGARFGDAWEIVPKRAELYTAVDITPEHGKLLARNGRPVLADRIRHYGSKTFPPFMWPSAGLNASLDDLIAFELALRSGRIVTPALLAEMAQPATLTDGRTGDYGLGLIVGQMDGRTTLAYGGGAATWRVGTPDDGLTVILLTNLQGSFPQVLAAEILKRAR